MTAVSSRTFANDTCRATAQCGCVCVCARARARVTCRVACVAHNYKSAPALLTLELIVEPRLVVAVRVEYLDGVVAPNFVDLVLRP